MLQDCSTWSFIGIMSIIRGKIEALSIVLNQSVDTVVMFIMQVSCINIYWTTTVLFLFKLCSLYKSFSFCDVIFDLDELTLPKWFFGRFFGGIYQSEKYVSEMFYKIINSRTKALNRESDRLWMSQPLPVRFCSKPKIVPHILYRHMCTRQLTS